ncbi:TetR/AcrR family transcriptional regulator [Dactylosporangium sp. NPDC049525]|uniref:TetR/AcrR family transcriptional regulator n=1 Tax=Dactylosporangium sp. NPDC049525 TaxID=3154730 RepID=UPI003420F4EA
MSGPVKQPKKADSRPTRAEQARATRRRIIAAAAEQFIALGYGATRLDQVAERAGVAVQTVFFHFGNKRTLLKEALDVAAVGDDEQVALLERPWVEQIQRETDPQRIVELWMVTSRAIVERVASLMRVVRGATGTDPELAAQWDTNQQQIRTAHGFFVQLLAARGALKPGLGVEQAVDIAFVIGNVETYLQFSEVCGWTLDEWQQRIGELLSAALIADTTKQ